jgi:hypothetical protein
MYEAARVPGVENMGGMNVMPVSGPWKQTQIGPENKYGSEKVNPVEMSIIRK